MFPVILLAVGYICPWILNYFLLRFGKVGCDLLLTIEIKTANAAFALFVVEIEIWRKLKHHD